MSGYRVIRAAMLIDVSGRPVGFIGEDGQEYFFPRFSQDQQAVVRPDGSALSGTGTGFVLQPATSTALGGVKAGTGVTIASDGTITVALPTGGGGGGGGSTDIPFATTVPLTYDGSSYMPRTKVSPGMSFTPAAGAVRGALVYMRLLGDGSTVPTFSGMLQWGGSLDFDPRLNIENQVQVFSDGTSVFYSITQAANAQPIPVAATALLMSGPSGGVVSTASTNFTVSANGTLASPVTVTPSAGAGGGTFSPSSATVNSGQSVTFTYTPASVGAKSITLTNNAGLTNPASITYTVSATAPLRFSPLSRVAESGTGPYTYVGSGAGSGFGTTEGDAALTMAFQSGADGEAVIKCLTTPTSGSGATNELVVGVHPTNVVDKKYFDLFYGVVGHAAIYDYFAGQNYSSGTSGVGAAANDYIRVRRTGTALNIAVSKDSGANYTTVASWTGVTTSALYLHVLVTGTGSWTPISSSGLA